MANAASAFEAFTPQVVVDHFARKIDSLCVWNETLLAGLSDGSLLCFQEQPNKQGAAANARWQVTAVHKGFGRRTISQLQVLGDEPLLLSLTDDGVSLHSLPDLKPHGQASRTAKAAAFAWDQGRHLLAVAAKKKVSTHSLSSPGNEFLELTEYALPENPVALSWVQSNIIVGTKKSVWLIVPQPPQAVEVLPGQHMQLYPTVAPQLLFAAGASGPALITPLLGRQGEVLVTKDGHSFFIQSDGKVSRKAQLQWSVQPLALVAGDLYAVALLPQCVEVKSVSRISGQTVTQIMQLPDMALAAPRPATDGAIYIASASEAGIRRLTPVPLPRQARLLASSGEFQAALELCGRLVEGEAKRLLEDSLRLQFGHRLFEAGEYDEGLTQFSMCSDASPLLLLRLFPALVPPKFQQFLPDSAYGEPLPPAPSASSTADAVAVVIPYLLSHRTRILASLAATTSGQGAGEGDEDSQRSSSGGGASSSGAGNASPLRTQQRVRRQASFNGQTSGGGRGSRGRGRQPGSKAGSDSGSERGSSVAGSSPGASPRAGSTGRSPSPPKRLPGSPLRRGAGEGASNGTGDGADDAGDASAAPAQQLRLVATIIDTAIMLAMLRQADTGALLRLLQQQNFVDLDEGVGALADMGRYAELVALYQYNARHAEGLELLRRLSQDPASLPAEARGVASDLAGLPGVWAAVRYLVSMRPPDLNVVRDHAAWILEADPEAGLEAFLHMRPPLPPKVVLSILQSCAPDYCPVYLESALDMGLAAPDEFHSELLLMYLSMALEEEAGGQESAAQHARKLSLSDLLVNRPRVPLKLFPDDPKQMNTAPFAAAPPPTPARGRRSRKGGPGRITPVALRPRAGAAAAANTSVALPASPRSPSPPPGTPRGAANGVLSEEGEGMELASLSHGRRPDAYQRLRDLVYSSPHINPEYVLAKLPPSSLLEIRALMLERLGRHREALTLYVHGLKDLQLAEAYCDRVYAAAAGLAGKGGVAGGLLRGPARARGAKGSAGRLTIGEPADIYTELVEAVVQGAGEMELQPLPLDANTWQLLCGLLSRKLDRIDATHVLDMLPPDLPLSSALTLLGSALLHCTETGRNLSVVRSLRRWENLSSREDLVSAKQRSVVLSQERACCLCHKRIGNGSSVFVAYPTGSLAHYLCFKRAGGAAVGAPAGVLGGDGADDGDSPPEPATW